MDNYTLLILACTVMVSSAWPISYYSSPRMPIRVTGFAPLPLRHRTSLQPAKPALAEINDEQWQRSKRDHHDDYDHEHDYPHDRDRDHDHGHGHGHGHRDSSGITGPVHTFVKTDKNANYKWGVRHHVGNKFAS